MRKGSGLRERGGEGGGVPEEVVVETGGARHSDQGNLERDLSGGADKADQE